MVTFSFLSKETVQTKAHQLTSVHLELRWNVMYRPFHMGLNTLGEHRFIDSQPPRLTCLRVLLTKTYLSAIVLRIFFTRIMPFHREAHGFDTALKPISRRWTLTFLTRHCDRAVSKLGHADHHDNLKYGYPIKWSSFM
jgi:predicted secreted protein